MSEPLDVSVVVPVRDGARYLATALDSALDQVPAPREVVVVDDGSTDETAAVMARYDERITPIHQPPLGYSAAMNRGILAATSTWLGFVDSDDEWTADALARRWAAIVADPDVELVSGRMEQFVSPDLPDAAKARFKFDPGPARAQLFGTLLLRRSTFLAIGPFDETLPTGGAVDWMARARGAAIRTAEIDDVVLRRRLHDRNMGVTLGRDVTRQALRDVVRAHHARRRPGGGG